MLDLRPGPSAIRFVRPHPFLRFMNAMRGKYAVRFTAADPRHDSPSRQRERARLRVQAAVAVLEANPKLERKLRRKLARAYAAKWRRERR